MKKLFLLILILSEQAVFATTWYVSPAGSNNLNADNGKSTDKSLQTIAYAFNTAASPGDTVFVMQGIYSNSGYGTGSMNNGSVVYLNNSGAANNWIVLRNYPGDSVKLLFDGAGGITGGAISYVEISGFEIVGPNSSITLDSALAHRLDNPKLNFYQGRGIAIWGQAHHIKITNNKVYDCPGSGIRVNKGDYISVSNNEVFNNTWYSSSAESAIVFAESTSVDTKDTVKMIMSENVVYNNYNQIPFFTPNPPDIGVSDYGTAAQDFIIDGSGVYITRNETYTKGWFYLANNISYCNGINGVVVHKTDRAIVVNNTSFMNGKVPLSSGRQNSSGITINSVDSIYIYNNISWPRFDSDYGYKTYGTVTNIDAESNILVKGLSDFSSGISIHFPLFADTANKDFSLLAGSPAIDSGKNHEYVPFFDFAGNERIGKPDIGALEHQSVSTAINEKHERLVHVYPNPFTENIYIDNSFYTYYEVFNILGHAVVKGVLQKGQNCIDLSFLASGEYVILLEGSEKRAIVIIKN